MAEGIKKRLQKQEPDDMQMQKIKDARSNFPTLV